MTSPSPSPRFSDARVCTALLISFVMLVLLATALPAASSSPAVHVKSDSSNTGIRPAGAYAANPGAVPAPLPAPAAPVALALMTFLVTKTADTSDGVCDADCSLREAIIAANANTGADTITLPAGTYTLTDTDGGNPGDDDAAGRRDLDINESLTINGAGSATTIIEGGTSQATSIGRVFDIGRTPISAVHANINNVTIRYGKTTGIAIGGGAIRFDGFNPASPVDQTNNGSLTLVNCVVTDNTATGDGGGIRAGAGNVTITNSTISNNSTPDGDGGGLFFQTLAKTVTITGTTFSNNTVIDAGLNNDVFGNPFFGKGGGAHISSSALGTIQNSTFTGNKAEKRGGGLQLFAPVSISDTNFTSNTAGFSGGAIYHDLSPTEGASFDSTINRAVFKGNKADVNPDGTPNNSANQNSAGHGGAVFHDRDVLTITNSLFGGTAAGDANTAQNGGAIATSVNTGSTGEPGTLNVRNTTISGNSTSGYGGGILNGAGNLDGTGDFALNEGRTVVLTNVTVANNRANTDNAEAGVGGGVARLAGTTTLQNTIAAGNFRGTGATGDDTNGTLAGSFSLIGIATGSGLTTGVNSNFVGSAGTPVDARLGPLQQNGGLAGMLTHALLGVSLALDGGSNALATAAGLTTTDQRGTGFARALDAGDPEDTTDEVDMGAYEAHPSVQNVADQMTNEDTQIMVAAHFGDVDLGFDSITAVSGTPGLVPNPGISGSGSSRTLTFTPNANLFGTSTVTVTITDNYNGTVFNMVDTFVLTVVPIADTPTVTNATTNEDTQTTSGLVVTRNVVDGPEVSHFRISNIQNGTLFKNDGTTAIANNSFITFAEANAGLKFTPDANEFTPNSTFTFDVQGATSAAGTGLSPVATATITVNPVADTPTVTNATTFVNTQTTSGLVVSRNVVDGPEVTHFKITAITNGTLFQNDGTTQITNGSFITFAQANAGLKFTPTTDFSGAASFGVQASLSNLDAGLGGSTVTATITVNKFNSTTTITSDNPDPSVSGQSVTVNFTVVNASAANPAPTGNVVITVSGGAETCTGTVAAGTCSLTLTTVGARTLTATYAATAAFNGSSDTEPHQVVTPPDITVKDSSVAEPASGSNVMTFTVVLSAASPAQTTVNFATADNTAKDGVGEAEQDYTNTSGTLTFNPGETVQTISVPVLADADGAEIDETFLVNLSGAVLGNITDGAATGTITTANPSGTVIITELRTSGPGAAGTGDANDDFVEVYNNSDSPVIVADSSGAPTGTPGWALVKMGSGGCGATPVIVGIIPNGTNIPARGHYLFVGTGYSLANYGGAAAAAGDLTLTANLEADANVALFNTSKLADFGSLKRLDAVGFSTNVGNNCDLLREGTTLPAAAGSTTQHSFVRKVTLVAADVPTPTDANDNSADFYPVSTTANVPISGAIATPVLGNPGPENRTGPTIKKFSQVGAHQADPTKLSSAEPNRVRKQCAAPSEECLSHRSSQGTISMRRRFVNNTGVPISKLRFRVYLTNTFQGPSVPVGTADLRAITSGPTSATVTGIPGTVTINGTTVEMYPTQQTSDLGGGWNSTFAVPASVIGPGTALAPGASVYVQFLFGVQQGGSFSVLVHVEALP